MRSALLFVFGAALWAHDAPAHVTVRMHLRPEGQTLRALVRLPLEAIRDVDFPALPGGYLDVAALAPRLPGLAKLWVADVITLTEDGAPLPAPRVVATRLSLESDRSFATAAEAEALFRSPLPANDQKLFWKQVYFDLALEYPIRAPHSSFTIRPDFANLGETVQTVLHYRDRTFLLPGDPAAFPLDPHWWQASALFVRLGFIHILEGLDHLLFLFCLVLACRQFRPLVLVTTAFTAAHSLTLAASALGLAPDALWFPPLVELAIAASIVYLALANIVGANIAGAGHNNSRHGAWPLAFAFGLVHGFGFSFALREQLQFAGSHLTAALLAFNLGVELGQLLALAVMVPVLALLFRRALPERTGTILLSALVAHTGWHWLWERAELLRKYTITLPPLDAAFLATWLRWAMLLTVAWALVWVAKRFAAK